jgi:hypothetical protein
MRLRHHQTRARDRHDPASSGELDELLEPVWLWPERTMPPNQEILVRLMTRLSTFRGEAAFRPWAHRVTVNHLLDRKRGAVERLDLGFGAVADDLLDG